MSIIEAIIFGIVQGITEFVPISSSGHLVLLHNIFDNSTDILALSFDVALHVGTLIALFIYFWHDIVNLVKSFVASIIRTESPFGYRLPWILVVGTIPAVLVGLFFENIIEETFRSVVTVAVMLIFVGLIMIAVEKLSGMRKTINDISWLDGILIGLAQALALIPGTSRSGITIITGMTLKLTRKEAARFSFLLAIPAVFGAGIKKAFDLVDITWTSEMIIIWVIGVLTSIIFGWLAIKWLLKYLSTNKLYVFAWYRIILGIILLIFFI